MHYDTIKNLGDQVHSNKSLGKFVKNKFQPLIIEKKSSARKFFHYHKSNYDSKNYLILNAGVIKELNDLTYKIRVLTDDNYENVKNYNAETNQPITSIDIDQEFPDLKNKTNKVAIIQLESNDFNFEGSFMHCNTNDSIVAIDHLTGG